MSLRQQRFRVAYILYAFPLLSETFILNEILALQKLAIDVHICSLTRPRTTVVHERVPRLIQGTLYLEGISRKEKLRALLHVGVRHPLRLLKTFAFVLANADRGLLHSFKQAFYLANELSQLGVQHVHAHFAIETAEHAMLVRMLTGIPYSMTAHAVDIYVASKRLREKMDYAEFMVTVCEYNKTYLLDYHGSYPEHRIHVIRVGIDLDQFTGERHTRADKSGQSFHVVSIARLIEKKGLKYLIDALALLDVERFSFCATIVGDGPLRPELAAAIERYDLVDRVCLVGPKRADEIVTILAEADLFVLPCVIAANGDRDATPTVLMEAMAMGIPVISTTVGGIPEVVPSAAGVLVPPGDVVALAKSIHALHEAGPVARLVMGQHGRRHVETRYNIAIEARRLAELLRQVS